ncbi:tripartite tricarboxylate transporter substrate binding protein [Alcaligenaceae bacterium]|nr:tripartite tricarboxylate transporter substrate binding protein [Alcaligenaceae bacterium]
MRQIPLPSLRFARIQRFAAVTGTLLALSVANFASAQEDYPTRPIHLIIGFSAGGNTDVMGRAAAAEMSKVLGQPVVVENRAGGAGSIMANATIASPPDGYTMCLCGSGPQVLLPLIDKTAENYPRDLAPVSLLYVNGYILIGRNNLKANNIQELLADIKANPNKYTYGSSGVGGIQHLGLAMLANTIGSPMLHVPYKGEQPAAIDVAAGQVDLLLATPTTAAAMLKTGKVKAFASTGEKPNELMPELPTLKSVGLDNMLVYTFGGLNVTRGTPPGVIQKLSDAAAAAVSSDSYQERVKSGGMSIPSTGPKAYADFVSHEIDRWSEVTKNINFKRK